MLKNAIIGAATLTVVMLVTPVRAHAQSQQPATDPCANATDKVQCALDQSLAKIEALRLEAAKRDAERQRAAQTAQQQKQQGTTAAATAKTAPATKAKPGSACKTYPVCEAK